MYAPLTIANTIIQKRPGSTPLALQKLVYFAHGWSLAFDKPLLGELPAVFEYGPIYSSLYNAHRGFRNVPLLSPTPIPHAITCPIMPDTDAFGHGVIDQIVTTHGGLTDIQLSNLAHAEGSPWHDERNSYAIACPAGTVIPEWRLTRHFKHLKAEAEAKAA